MFKQIHLKISGREKDKATSTVLKSSLKNLNQTHQDLPDKIYEWLKRCVAETKQIKSLASTTLDGTALDGIECILFTPRDKEDRGWGRVMILKTQTENQLILPVYCKGLCFCTSSGGSGVWRVGSAHASRANSDSDEERYLTKIVFDSAGTEKNFRFHRIVLLPLWLRGKKWRHEIEKWFSNFKAVDAFFLLEIKRPTFLYFC